MRSSSAESTAAVRIVLDRGAKLVRTEVGPERVDEHELGIRRLPEKEVRDAQLARRPDHEVGIGHLRRIQMPGEERLVDVVSVDAALCDAPCSFDELCASAVVECDPEIEPRLVCRRLFELGELRLQPVWCTVATADEASAHTL